MTWIFHVHRVEMESHVMQLRLLAIECCRLDTTPMRCEEGGGEKNIFPLPLDSFIRCGGEGHGNHGETQEFFPLLVVEVSTRKRNDIRHSSGTLNAP